MVLTSVLGTDIKKLSEQSLFGIDVAAMYKCLDSRIHTEHAGVKSGQPSGGAESVISNPGSSNTQKKPMLIDRDFGGVEIFLIATRR